MPAPSIRLAIQDQFLECFKDEQLAWRTPISSILLIGEYTTDKGPYVDDYFVELWSLEDGAVLRASITIYAAGLPDAFLALAKYLNADLAFDLIGSTEWTSRIMWPPEFAGHPYFVFREVKPASWRQKLSKSLIGARREYALTEEVQAFLKKHKLPT